MVELTATPSADSDFDGWSGDCSGSGTCMVTMDQARSVTATFTEVTVPIEVDIIGNGTVESVPAGIDCPGTCQASFDFNAEISLFAVADSGSSFFNWGGDCTGSMICQVTLDEPKHVIGIFGDADFLFLDGFE